MSFGVVLVVLVVALFIAPTAGRLAGTAPTWHRTLRRRESNEESLGNNLTHGTKLVVVKPVESYRYTITTPSKGKPQYSLILLGPFNGTQDFYKSWLLSDFAAHEPLAKEQFRILDVVARKMPAWDSNSYPYNSWYEYIDWSTETVVDSDVELAVEYVHGLIEKEYAIVGDYRHIILAGYSQGANVALEAALSFPHRLGLVFSQRGILLPRRTLDSSPVAPTPYILTAGEYDVTYHSQWVDSDRRWLEEKHAPAYLKTLDSLDHIKRSSRESQLTIKAFAAMTTDSPDLARLTDWTVGPK